MRAHKRSMYLYLHQYRIVSIAVSFYLSVSVAVANRAALFCVPHFVLFFILYLYLYF